MLWVVIGPRPVRSLFGAKALDASEEWQVRKIWSSARFVFECYFCF